MSSAQEVLDQDTSTQNVDVLSHAATLLPYASLAIIFFWFGGMKFTDYEAQAIKGLVANSPFMSFLYNFLDVHSVSYLIGTSEIVIGILLVLRLVSPQLSLIGALGAVGVFALTSTFFASTPGVVLPDVGFPAISVLPGQFLLKDIGLLALAIVAANESRKSLTQHQSDTQD